MMRTKPVNTLSKPELEKQLSELCRQYEDVKGKGLKLNMARGKPAASQLDLSMDMLHLPADCTLEDGTDDALITFRNRYSRNLLVFSYIFFFISCFGLIQSRYFQDFSSQ